MTIVTRWLILVDMGMVKTVSESFSNVEPNMNFLLGIAMGSMLNLWGCEMCDFEFTGYMHIEWLTF